MAGKQRHEEIRDGGAQQAAQHHRDAGWLPEPVTKYERQHHTDRRGALARWVDHGFIRLRSRTGPAPSFGRAPAGRAQASLKTSVDWELLERLGDEGTGHQARSMLTGAAVKRPNRHPARAS